MIGKKLQKKLKLTLVKNMLCAIIECMRKTDDIERQLKQALEDSGMSRAEVARKSKGRLSEAQLSYFVNDKRSLSVPSLAALARILGLELRLVERGK